MSPKSSEPTSCYLVPNLRALDPAAREVDLATHTSWVQPTVIEDEDLTFGGKALSALYEEERRRLSGESTADQEQRGRKRVRESPDRNQGHEA